MTTTNGHHRTSDGHLDRHGRPGSRGSARALTAALLAILVLAACGGENGSDGGAARVMGGDRLEVVASFYPVAEAVARVGGERVQVTNLTPAGAEPHDFELTSRQVDQLEDADLAMYLGQGFQPAVEKVVDRRKGPSIDVLDGIDLEEGAVGALEEGHAEEEGRAAGAGEHDEGEEGHEEDGHEEDGHGEDGLDPHFWLDPRLMAEAVDAIAAALSDASPEGAAAFRENAAAYRAELEELDKAFEDGLATCERKEFVTSHAAFHYLARRYGLTQLPIAGLSPEAEPDAARLAELSDRIKAGSITTVFYEELVSPRVAEALAREAGVDTAVLNPIEGLSAEVLEAGGNYDSVMRENLAALRTALGCT